VGSLIPRLVKRFIKWQMGMVGNVLGQDAKRTFSDKHVTSRWKTPAMTLSVLLAMPSAWWTIVQPAMIPDSRPLSWLWIACGARRPNVTRWMLI